MGAIEEGSKQLCLDNPEVITEPSSSRDAVTRLLNVERLV